MGKPTAIKTDEVDVLDPIDEAILFFLLTVTFAGRSQIDPQIRALLIDTSVADIVARDDNVTVQEARGFEERYAEFVRRLNDRMVRTGISQLSGPLGIHDEPGLTRNLSFVSTRQDDRSVIQTIERTLREWLQRRADDQAGVPATSQTVLPGAGAELPVRGSVAEPSTRNEALATVFSNTAKFATDPNVGVVSFDRLKEIYERETGV
ncbi:hypothetical protein [Paraburkholderia bryophila]|uniref:Uncharacterized protein n=1 Tax=Paraburkholderia bryophila TaxID=420952 RepID=A0A7Z0B806_9BURK|nr:hypothetical protein [Paraburkholderia bryophila]NYH22882.1 hypothetical protein [Paraburkholderia bryophila]